MQKKYQVFISSTYSDLIDERRKIQEILLMADCIPAGMEAFVATNDEQFNVIKKVIDLCDYYILVIGGRYGSINETSGLSYTEMEYDYAISQSIPVLVFAIDSSILLEDNKKENEPDKIEKLSRFRDRAMKNRLASVWKTNSDLFGQVAISLMKAKTEINRPGWTRGAKDQSELLLQMNELQSENKNLIEKNKELSIEIDNLLAIDDDLEFDDNKLKIEYSSSVNGYSHSKEISLKEIFGYVSINMINVSILEDKLVDLIVKSIGASSRFYLTDKNICKKICNQFLALKLMFTKWIDGKGLYYGLTKKGIKLRDELNLIKKGM